MSCELLIKLSSFFPPREGTCWALTSMAGELQVLRARLGSRPGLDPVGELEQGLLAVDDVQVGDVGL